jgi:hypothetical protein
MDRKTKEHVGKIVTALEIGLHSIYRPGGLLKTSIASLSLCRPIPRTVTITYPGIGINQIFFSRQENRYVFYRALKEA